METIFAGDNKIILKKYMLSNNLYLDTTNCFIGSNIIRIYLLHLRLTIPNLLPSGPSKSDPTKIVLICFQNSPETIPAPAL